MIDRPLSIVHTENSCGWGGQEVRILTESRGLLGRGHRVTLLSPPEAPITEAARKMGVPVQPLGMRRKRIPDLLALRAWLAAHRGKVDVLNTHSSTDSWLGAIARTTLGGWPPIVRTRHVSTTVHDNAGTRWLYHRGNDHIVTTGEAVRRQIAAEIGLPLDRMTSIPTGIDLQRFVPGDAHPARRRLGLQDKRAIGIMATLRAWKGHIFLFAALAQDREAWKDWQLLVIGGGPDRDVLEEFVRKDGLTDCVTFTGHQDDVVPWLQALDLFALPSSGEEGVPQAIMQAMACGIPVVSTRIGAIAEAVEAEVTGLLVPPKTIAELGAALGRLRDDPALCLRFSRAARERAERLFGIDLMLDRMEAVFRRVTRS
jgi:glycosyltransferase involved in cell wall biosynthesis